jgi:uncharacterized protein (DUF362 family)
MKEGQEKVSVLRCKSYRQSEVYKTIERSLKLIDFDFSKYKGKKVLLKPNLVTAKCKKPIATLTNKSILEGLCKMLKKNKCKIYIGESSFMDTDEFFKKLGYHKLAKKYGAKLIVFEQDKLKKIKNKNYKILGEFPVSKTLTEMDLIIDLPKMKTHSLMRYTGAIKNFFGLIPGGLKQRLHLKAKGEKRFAELMLDIYQNFIPGLVIMDGVIGMEGQGPTSGCSKKSNLILASKSGVALDICATKIMGFGPKEIKTNYEAIKRKLYPNYEFNLVGLKKLPLIHFDKAHIRKTSSLRKIFLERKILCDHKKCIKCGLCARKCPAKAITLKPYPVINRKKCIRCFCCLEVCPQEALSLEK